MKLKNDARGMGGVSTDAKKSVAEKTAAPSPGGVAVASLAGKIGAGGSAGVAEAERVVEEARTRAKRSDAGAPRGARAEQAQQAALDAELSAIAQDLYSAENFEDLVALPGDIGFALTGHEHWLPTDRARRILARTGAAAARLMRADPRYLALGLFTTALLSTYGGAALKEIYIRRQEKANAIPSTATVETPK